MPTLVCKRRCHNQMHTVRLHPNGRLSFPGHPAGTVDFEAAHRFQQIGGVVCGCANHLRAWRAGFRDELPAAFARERMPGDPLAKAAWRAQRRLRKARNKAGFDLVGVPWWPGPPEVAVKDQHQSKREAALVNRQRLAHMAVAHLRRRGYAVRTVDDLASVVFCKTPEALDLGDSEFRALCVVHRYDGNPADRERAERLLFRAVTLAWHDHKNSQGYIQVWAGGGYGALYHVLKDEFQEPPARAVADTAERLYLHHLLREAEERNRAAVDAVVRDCQERVGVRLAGAGLGGDEGVRARATTNSYDEGGGLRRALIGLDLHTGGLTPQAARLAARALAGVAGRLRRLQAASEKRRQSPHRYPPSAEP